MLKAIFFGVPQIYYNQDLLTGTLSGRCLALFVYLALADQPQDRGHLADLLWSEIGEQQARQNLRYVLYDLRKLVGDYLIVTRHTIAFTRQNPHWIDANIFTDYLATKAILRDPALLQDLLRLYQDEFLNGFWIQNAPGFEEWLIQQRLFFRQQASQALLLLSNHYLRQGDYTAGLPVNQRLLQLEPWHEEVHRNQMSLFALSGQRLAALAQYATCQQVLRTEFGVEPEPATKALYEAIEAGKLAPPVQPKNSGQAPPIQVNWDAIPPTNQMHGRTEELARLQHWLSDPQHRLLGLFGLTGQGKSALAAELVAQLAEAPTNDVAAPPIAVVLWSSLTNFRTLPQLLQEWLIQLDKTVAPYTSQVCQHGPTSSLLSLVEPMETVETLLQRLILQLRRRRVLLIIDGGEALYGSAGPLTEYQPGWGAFNELLRRLADNDHRSCLLLISRITPVAWETLARRCSAVRTLFLTGLSVEASVALLQTGGCTLTAPLYSLAEQCAGHPQSLESIRELLDSFGVDLLAAPLIEPCLVGSALHTLQTQFARLTSLEQTILWQLTLLPTPATVATLWQQIPHTWTFVAYLEALHALQRQQWLLPSRSGAPLLLAPLVKRFLEQQMQNRPAQKNSVNGKLLSDEGGQLRSRCSFMTEQERLRHVETHKGNSIEVAPVLYLSIPPATPQ